jgi:hypothetical protein
MHRRWVFAWISQQFVFEPVNKNPGAFGIIEEGNLLDNFGIQSLEYFCLKNLRKLSLK